MNLIRGSFFLRALAGAFLLFFGVTCQLQNLSLTKLPLKADHNAIYAVAIMLHPDAVIQSDKYSS